MQFAASYFVVVSPLCEWQWTDFPSNWVIELIEALRALDWIDYKRIYLTGYSMGGMGVWELGARNSELFAAVAPVAAHHKTGREEFIAKRLMLTPIHAFHDLKDCTCRMKEEEALWKKLAALGHKDFQMCSCVGYGHPLVPHAAYCSNEFLYRWLLERSI